jgi:ATP-dependent Clp protease ATP-binding subunit ClpA
VNAIGNPPFKKVNQMLKLAQHTKFAGTSPLQNPVSGLPVEIQQPLQKDVVSIRFGSTSAAAPIYTGATPSQETQFFLELMKNQNLAGNPNEDWPFAYGLYLLRTDESVRKYVKDQFLQPDDLIQKLQPTVKKLLAKNNGQRSTISEAKAIEIISQAGQFALTQGSKEMTTLHFWRWMMSQQPSATIQAMFKEAGLNDQQLETLKKAPASVELPSLGRDMVIGMRNLKNLNMPYPADTNWAVYMLQNLMTDSSVKEYLNANNINFNDLYVGIATNLEPHLVSSAKRVTNNGAKEPIMNTLSETCYTKIIDNMKRFALNEGSNLVTPVLAWRYIMTQESPELMTSYLKVALKGASEDTIARYRQAPAQVIKKEVGSEQTRPTKADIQALKAALAKVPEVVIGQQKPLELLLNDIARTTLGYAHEKNPNKPKAVVLMLGPSGVGKTYSAQEIASTMGRQLISYSMNEFKDGQNKAKLTGAAPGYTGFGEAKTLADKIIEANQSTEKHGTPPPIVLFDEIEKAHPEVFDVIMQIFDQGVLQNGKGETASFKGCYILMTSNIGQRQIAKAKEKGFDEEKIQSLVKAILEGDKEKSREILGEDVEQDVNMGEYQQFAGFRPEFIGRINSFAIFETLSKENVGKILDIEMGRIKKAAKKLDGYDLDVKPNLRAHILERGFSQKTGAREVKNEMEKILHNALVGKREELIMNDQLDNPGGKMEADWEGEAGGKGKVVLKFTPGKPASDETPAVSTATASPPNPTTNPPSVISVAPTVTEAKKKGGS